MLSDNYKKASTDEKKAFFYFGFERLAPFNHVKDVIEQAIEAADEETLEKIKEQIEHIENYFDTPELKEDDSLNVPFKKDKRRAKWKSLKKDLPEFKNELNELISQKIAEIEGVSEEGEEGEIAPVESEEVVFETAESDDGEIAPVDETDVESDEGEIESVEEGDIEPAESDDGEIELVEEGDIEPVESDDGEIELVVEDDIEPVIETPVEVEKPKTKIYINGELLGYCEDPVNFTQEMREKRRKGEISHEMNITYYEDNDEIYIFNDPGRARRPLIIVKEGIPLLREEHLNKVANGKLKWDDLINDGLIEYLDAEEEENSYIAMTLADLTEEHTHLEIDPATMLGICAGIIKAMRTNAGEILS